MLDIRSRHKLIQAEMSLSAKERGPEVSYQLALLITGVALAYWVDLGFVQGLGEHPWLWRIPLAMQSLFAIFSACLLFLLPDTPRWYYARGRTDKGDDVLARLHALPVEHPSVQLVRSEILASLKEEEGEEKFNWIMLFWDNTELQFGRRLRTSFLINWVGASQNVKSFPDYFLPHTIGTTVSWNQHACLLQHHDFLKSQLLASLVWNSSRCA